MAYNKVVIAGINTSELTVLKEEEKIALLKEIRATGSREARDRLIKGNLRLVLSVIQRFTGRGEEVDDLFQIGVVGLIKAINNFDLSKEVRFSTYCVPADKRRAQASPPGLFSREGQPLPQGPGIQSYTVP